MAAVLPLLGEPGRWAVRALPGPHEPPGPGAPRGRRDRWWHDHVSAVGGVLVLADPEVDVVAVGRAVQLLAVCAAARDRGTTDPAVIARGVPDVVVRAAVGAPVGGPGDTAVDALRAVTGLFPAVGER